MSNIYTSADQLIGKTPLLELTHIEETEGLKARLLVKLPLRQTSMQSLNTLIRQARSRIGLRKQ